MAREETRPDAECRAQQTGCWLPRCGSACGGMSTGLRPSYKHRCRATGAFTELGTGRPTSVAQALRRSTEEGTRRRLPRGGEASPTPGIGVGVAKWNRLWGKSIGGRGLACAKAQKDHQAHWQNQRQPDGKAEWRQGPVGERALSRGRVSFKYRDTTALEMHSPRAQSYRSASHSNNNKPT